MKRRTDSASRRSWSAVEPTRSAKTMLTTLREAVSGGVCAAARVAIAAPQASQKRAFGGLSAPHAVQRGASEAPQPPQKRAPAAAVHPQLAQTMGDPSTRPSVLLSLPRGASDADSPLGAKK